MLSSNYIKESFIKNGANSCGIIKAREFTELLPMLERRGYTPFVKADLDKRINPFAHIPDAKTVIACTYNYRSMERQYSGGKKLALYTNMCGYRDYVRERLIAAATALDLNKYKVFADSGTLCERHIAYLAGLGYFGLNNLLYSDNGSYFNIGVVVTDAECDSFDHPCENKCTNCMACINACPTHALSPDYGFDHSRCISYLTSAKELSLQQQELLQQSDYIKGCDICAAVCPLNKLPKTQQR